MFVFLKKIASQSVAAVFVCMVFAMPVAAHDHWIAHGQYRSPQDGSWCCGADDCFVVPSASVKANGVGFEITSTKEVVPYSETLPSIDGKYWRCHRPDGSRRCFFAPTVGF